MLMECVLDDLALDDFDEGSFVGLEVGSAVFGDGAVGLDVNSVVLVLLELKLIIGRVGLDVGGCVSSVVNAGSVFILDGEDVGNGSLLLGQGEKSQF